MVAGGLRGMGVVAAALVLSTAAKLAPGLRGNPLGLAACAAFAVLTALAIGWLRWPLVWVVLGLGLPACALARWRLAKS
jgi:chromate transporter